VATVDLVGQVTDTLRDDNVLYEVTQLADADVDPDMNANITHRDSE
jgi:hypothetical protein